MPLAGGPRSVVAAVLPPPTHPTKEEALSDTAEGLASVTQLPQEEPTDPRLYFFGSAPLPRNALNRSMGIGKITMFVRSVAISFSVPR